MNAYVRTTGNGYQIMCIQGARILGGSWRNFSGEARTYDSGGKHHFAIEIEERFVQLLKDFGFNVGFYQRDDNPGFYHLDITVSWSLRDPDVNVVAYNGVKTHQSEATIGDLDRNTNIDFADMELTAYHWTMPGGRSGVKPYAEHVYIYLGQPSSSEQRYQERFQTPVQPELPNMPEAVLAGDEYDIPF
ncbi:MAG: hypothetical protein J6Y20_05570 [Lachnospiraceae bacterium]|nr:hypothetical protein [Lachnospiraceae bacterium]